MDLPFLFSSRERAMRKAVSIALALFLLYLPGCQGNKKEQRIDRAHGHLRIVAAHIAEAFNPMQGEVIRVAIAARDAYLNKDSFIPSVNRKKYGLASTGIFYKKVQDENPSMFVSALTPVTDSVRETVYLTEALDQALIAACKHPSIVQTYYNSRLNLSRIYPPVDVLNQFDPHIDILKFAFYYEADAAHNPGKGPVWLPNPYVDPAGRGWIVSLICPVYVHNRLEGVAGLDVAVSTVAKTFPTLQDKSVLMIDHEGAIITGNDALTSLLSMPPVTQEKYLKSISDDQGSPKGHSLLESRSRDVREMAKRILHHNEDRANITIRGKKHTVIAAAIPEPGWTILRIMD